MDCIVIGIAGGSGSGKSTFTNKLHDLYGDKVTVIYHDNYYRRNDHLSLEERRNINYDHPGSLETDMLIEHIKMLKKGEPVSGPVYDYTVHNRRDETVKIYPNKIILLEGIMVLQDRVFRNCWILRFM